MNSLFRTVARSTALRPVSLPRPSPSTVSGSRPKHKSLIPLASIHARFVASSVSGRPGSQTIEHARTNVKEEVGNSAADWARSIAGGVFTVDSVHPTKDNFVGITSAIATTVPTPYLVMGLAGGLPYVASAGTTVYLAHQAGLAAMGTVTNLDPGVALTILDQALNFQVTYGAVMLSFLGALHWGMEFAGLDGHKGYPRLLLGVTPAMLAWSTITLQPTSALICQWVGFTALWYADNKATTAGWTPKWYSQYRFYLSILVGTCIIGSLAGISYYGPVAGHGLLSHDLERIRAIRKQSEPEQAGYVKGDIEAVAGDENSDTYVVVRKKEKKPELEGSENGNATKPQAN